MPPCIVDSKTKVGTRASNALNLASIKKAIPDEVFQKSFFKSSMYMLLDYALWAGSVYAMHQLSGSAIWASMPQLAQFACTFVFWNVAGFFMWCMFMIGHDCGHTNFCDSILVNDIIGHLTHGSLLVPYFPWQLSHRRHHMYHNHVEKDYSHPWYTPDRLERPDEGMARMMHSQTLLRGAFPFYGWHIYLYGMPDGSHYLPFTSQRMWANSVTEERVKCVVSTVVAAAFAVAFFKFYGSNLATFAYYYLGPYVVRFRKFASYKYLTSHCDNRVDNPITIYYSYVRIIIPYLSLYTHFYNIQNSFVVHLAKLSLFDISHPYPRL